MEKISLEGVKRFYGQTLIPRLASSVANAEQARQVMNHQAVEEIFAGWIWRDPQTKKLSLIESILDRVRERNVRFNGALSKEKDLIEAGYAGLGRIEHVDANTELKSLHEEDSALRQDVLLRISRVRTLVYRYLDLKNLVSWTIHGGAIYWPAEITQDDADTEIILGNKTRAQQILSHAIDEARETYGRLSLRINLDVPSPDPEINYRGYRQRETLIGAAWALAILYARQGRLDQRVGGLTESLGYASSVDRFEPNPHRLATLALWALGGSLSREYSGSLSERIETFGLGILEFGTAVFEDRKAVLSVLKQFLNS